MKYLIVAMALTLSVVMLSGVSFAGTAPSTFDANCSVNWVNGGCGDRLSGKNDTRPTPVGAGSKRSSEPPDDCEHSK